MTENNDRSQSNMRGVVMLPESEEYLEGLRLIDETEEEMNFSKLSNPEAVKAWFQTKDGDLRRYGCPGTEYRYLAAIEEVALRTGAPNFSTADHIWRLELRLKRIED